MKIVLFMFLIPTFCLAKLSTEHSSGNGLTGKKYASSLVDNCIAAIIKFRPEYAEKAAEICSRLAQNKTQNNTDQRSAGRNLADCMAFMRQFSIDVSIRDSLCAKILSDLNLPTTKRRAEAETMAEPEAAL